MVRVDVHDHEFGILALARLPRGMGEELGGVEFLDGQAMDFIRAWDFHFVFSRFFLRRRSETAG